MQLKTGDATEAVRLAAGDRLVGLTEVATFLNVSARSVWRLAASGELAPPVKVGRCARWFVADLNAYLDRIRHLRDCKNTIVANRRGES